MINNIKQKLNEVSELSEKDTTVAPIRQPRLKSSWNHIQLNLFAVKNNVCFFLVFFSFFHFFKIFFMQWY